ncbi:MAG TPA: DUF5666 domain-containing protein [Terriglobales bacterium]|nr:DUF5666 domain-containing protein [Terriglobales bacterium]
MPTSTRFPSFAPKHTLAVVILAAITLVTVGCGGGSSTPAAPGGGNPNPVPTPSNTSAQIKMGDAPADRVISFEITVGPITLTPTSGSAVTALSGTRRLELSHLSGTNEPLALLNLPQGSYSSATLTLASPEVTFINSSGVLVKLQPTFNQAITVTFSSPISVGAASSIVSIDLNVANALTFDAAGNVTGVNVGSSAFTISTAAVAAEDRQGHEDGELEDMTGLVTAVSGSSFTISLGQNGVPLTFATDAATQFNDGAALATMLNTLVTVEGVTRSDGSLLATEVEGIENGNGAELEGLVTQVTGNPATQISFVAHDGAGSGVDDTKVGATISADISGAQFKVNKGSIDTSGIGGLPSPPNFPFDASTIRAGQRVEVESASSLSGTSTVAEKVKLQQQALVGTVSGLSGSVSAGPATFTLTLPSDSAFAMLSGKTTVSVTWQPGTDLHNLTSVNNGDTVRVRGLVFFTGTSFNMIARRIDQ